MKNTILYIIILLCPPLIINAQITVDTTYTPSQLADNVFFGQGLVVSNAIFHGTPSQIGQFYNFNSNNLSIAHGIIMGTGNMMQLNNDSTNMAGGTTFGMVTGSSDTDLENIINNNVNDVAKLEFDFVPFGDTIWFEYVFASEEYNEYVCSNFNDVFAFFLQGGSYTVPTNVALIPNTSLPVSINSINNGAPGSSSGTGNCSASNNSLNYSNYFIDNPIGSPDIEFDGLTMRLRCAAVVVPFTLYHLKLAIGDVTDAAFDSAVFLEANSLRTNYNNQTLDPHLIHANIDLIEDCNKQGALQVIYPNNTPNADTFNIINILGSAIEGQDYTLSSHQFIVPTGLHEATIEINVISDTLYEAIETAGLVVELGNNVYDTLYFIINNFTPVINTINILTCNSSYFWNGQNLTSSGTYTSYSENPCDPTYVLNLTIDSINQDIPVISNIGDTLYCNITGSFYTWVMDNGSQTITSSNFFVPSLAGNYVVYVSNSNACTSHASLPISVSVGINPLATKGNLQISPNPVTNSFILTGDNIDDNITIYNLLSEPLMIIPADNASSIEINISSIPSGLYILSTKGQFIKLIKN